MESRYTVAVPNDFNVFVFSFHQLLGMYLVSLSLLSFLFSTMAEVCWRPEAARVVLCQGESDRE